MTEWTQGIWISISLLVTAVVLSFGGMLATISKQQASAQQEEENSIAIVQEYRKYNQYDNTEIYPQDVISAIADSRGKPQMWVDSDDGASVNYNWKWTPNTDPTQFSPSYLSELLPVGGTYVANLIKDANGAIVRIEFRRD